MRSIASSFLLADSRRDSNILIKYLKENVHPYKSIVDLHPSRVFCIPFKHVQRNQDVISRCLKKPRYFSNILEDIGFRFSLEPDASISILIIDWLFFHFSKVAVLKRDKEVDQKRHPVQGTGLRYGGLFYVKYLEFPAKSMCLKWASLLANNFPWTIL